MIHKFLTITNIGKFHDCKAAGDVSFQGITLLYAENGRGKTTLCDILRSLRTGDGNHIQGRETLGTSGSPEVEIRLDESNASFKGNEWSSTFPGIRIFDSTFIHENVYAGEVVEHEQKKNLYRVIVGEKGVALAHTVDDFDAQIRDKDSDIRAAKTKVAQLSPASIGADEFTILEADPDIDSKVATKEAELTALRRAGEIATKSTLSRIAVPSLPANLTTVLGKQLDDVSDTAEEKIRQHLAEHTSGADGAWLAQGTEFLKGDKCPFCSQSLALNELVPLYRGYFDDAYEKLRQEVSTLSKSVQSYGENGTTLPVKHAADENQRLIGFWSEFTDVDVPELDHESLFDAMRTLGDAALTVVKRKAQSIFEPIVPGSDYYPAIAGLNDQIALVSEYNAKVDAANLAIAAKKGQTSAGDKSKAEQELTVLQAAKQRHEAEAASACQTYLDAKSAKTDLEQKKEAVKTELDKHSSDLFAKFQKRINDLLGMVTAGFRITHVVREYKGRSPRSTYQVVINDVPVSLGDERTPASEPSFRNTLSAGDRSTLALAFFFAQLELDPELSGKIVVFDDPFTSQDLSRRTWTQQRICRIAKKAKQVIVLSHEPHFLQLIHDNVPSAEDKTLQLCRIGSDNTTITPWNIKDANRGDYVKDYTALREFFNEGDGDLRDIARTIRLVLEGYLRIKFIGQFADNAWLGDFITKIRDARAGDILEAVQPLLEELEDINDYSKKYHHKQNPLADSESINDGELRGFVKRTLEVVGGF